MSRSRGKHVQERKRRHNRQIEEGTRQPKTKIKKKVNYYSRVVRLSQIDSATVIGVLDAVKIIKFSWECQEGT